MSLFRRPSLITTIVPLVPLGAQAQASWTNSEADKIAIAAGAAGLIESLVLFHANPTPYVQTHVRTAF